MELSERMNMHVQNCVGGAGDLALHFMGDLFAHTRQESQSNCVSNTVYQKALDLQNISVKDVTYVGCIPHPTPHEYCERTS